MSSSETTCAGTKGAVAANRSEPLRSMFRRSTTDAGFGLSVAAIPKPTRPAASSAEQPADPEREAPHPSIVPPARDPVTVRRG